MRRHHRAAGAARFALRNFVAIGSILSPKNAGEGYHTGLGLRTNDPQASNSAAIRMTGNTTSFTVLQP